MPQENGNKVRQNIYKTSSFMNSETLVYQKNFCVLQPVPAGLRMGVVVNVNMVSADSAAAVFCGVDNSVDHHLAAVRYDAGVHGDGMVGAGDGAA